MRAIHVAASDRVIEPTRHGSSVMKAVYVRGGAITNITQVAEATLTLGLVEVERHKHPTMWECYLVLEGRAVYHVGDEHLDIRRILEDADSFLHEPFGVAYFDAVLADSKPVLVFLDNKINVLRIINAIGDVRPGDVLEHIHKLQCSCIKRYIHMTTC